MSFSPVWASWLDLPALLSRVNMRQKCVAACPPYDLALPSGGMHVIPRFQLHILAAPGSAVFYSLYGFNKCGGSVCMCVRQFV